MKLLHRFSELSEPLKASSCFFLATLFQKGLQFLVTPIYTRVFSTDEYGSYSTYISWYQVIYIIATFSLANGVYNNGLIKFENNRKEFKAAMQGLNLVSCMVVFVCLGGIYLSGIEFIGLEKEYLLVLFLNLLFYPAFQFWSMSQRFEYKYIMLSISTIVMSIVTPVFSLFLYYIIHEEKSALIWGFSYSQILVGIIFFIVNMKESVSLYNLRCWKYAINFNAPLILHYLSSVILVQADRIMINMMCGETKAGIYSLACTFSMILTIISSSVNASFVPWEYKKIKENNFLQVKEVVNIIMIVMAIISLCLILVCPELVRIGGTKEYYDAVWIMPPIIVSTYYMMMYTLYANIEFYFEKTKFVMVASTFTAVLNVTLNSLLIPKIGYGAAGYTTLFSYVIYALVHYTAAKKICINEEMGDVYNSKKIWILALFVTIVGLLLQFLFPYIVIRMLLLIGLILILLKLLKKEIETFMNIRQEEKIENESDWSNPSKI